MAFEMPNFGGDDSGAGGDKNGHPAGSSDGFGTRGGHRMAGFGVPPRRTKVLAITLLIMLALVILFLLFDGVYTSYLWYHSIGGGLVFRTRIITQAVLFLVFGVLMALMVGANIWLAYRLRPPLTGVSLEQQALDRYRMGLAPFLTWILLGVSVLLGIAAGASSAGSWRTYLMWANSVPFGTEDAQFHKDIGFYVFTLPWLRHIQGFMVAGLLLSLLAALVTHYLYAGVALTSPAGARVGGAGQAMGSGFGSRATRAAQIHISILLGGLVLVKAYAYWLDRYSLSVDSSKITSGWAGPTYKDVHAVLPAKTILLVIAVLCALLFFGNAVRLTVRGTVPVIDRGGHAWALPALGVSLMVLASVVIGGVYPLAVQRFQVNPNQGSKEAPYIQRNIDATRAAFGLPGTTPYPAKATVTQNQLAADGQAVAQIRVADPSMLSAAFDQHQQDPGGASSVFPDTLAVDRYPVNGKPQDAIVGVSGVSLAGLPASQRTWYNEHLRHTHGYGFMAAKGAAVQADGSPDYLERNLPPSGSLGGYEPSVYFGSGLPDYSIVNGPAASTPGVSIGSFVNKLMYAAKFREPKILLSDSVNKSSRITYDRDPRQLVQAVAPWLTLDSATYPAVVDGRILWVVDGYTTTSAYPYATSTHLADGSSKVNYVRNAVKATVDAYTGKVTLYAWDTTDPILKTWMKAFPGTVNPRSAISANLMAHLRYPQDLFTAQRDLLGRYHVTSAAEFFSGASAWSVPADPTKPSAQPQAPSYLTLQLPGQAAPSFSIASTLTPVDHGNVAAYMAVDCDPTSQDYGKIRILEVPPGTTVPGPEQIQSTFQSAYAEQLNALGAANAKVVEGGLLTLPIGGGLLSVEPVYAQPATGPATYPLLKGVMVAFGSNTAFAPTLQQGLDEIFSGTSGATTGENPVTVDDQLKQALADAVSAQSAARAALSKTPPDWQAFGAAEQAVQQALARAQALENARQPSK